MRIRSRPEPRWRHESGAVLVEFAFVIVLLAILLFGIITFGLILSFKQGMTQAANDGARAAAVASAGTAAVDAQTAAARSVEAFGEECGVGGLTCTFAQQPCAPPAVLPECLEVTLVYDYDNFPLLPKLPLLSLALPSSLTSASSVEVNS